MTAENNLGQAKLRASVMDSGLCTGCGGCVELCPYNKSHRAATVVLFDCDRDEGRCYRYCPRTPTEYLGLQQALYQDCEISPEIGPFRGLYITRAADEGLRQKAQHGGTVTALLLLMLQEGLADGAVVSGQGEKFLPVAYTAKDAEGVLAAAGSKFANSPVVGEFNRASAHGAGNLAVVATPCQAMALAKMRANPAPRDVERLKSLKLVLGLFCGWTLDWEKMRALVDLAAAGRDVLALDIPPSKHACMEVTTPDGVTEVPIDQVNQCVRDCCSYCFDMTAEFADVSVGSSRSEAGWEVDKGWNQVIVRSPAGQQLLDLAREKGVLEFSDVSEGNLSKLKAASRSKKRKCLDGLDRAESQTQGCRYLFADDPAVVAVK